MTNKQKKTLWRIIAAAVLLVWAMFGPTLWLPAGLPFVSVGRMAADGTAAFALAAWARFLLPYLVIGWDVLWRAVRNIAHGQVFDENFLMAIATVGALFIGEYAEAVFVMLFYQVGELFQSYAVGKSRQSIAELMEIRPDYANVERDGQVEQVDPDEVEVGETILIKAGERVPLDGVVLEGRSDLDTARSPSPPSTPRSTATDDPPQPPPLHRRR